MQPELRNKLINFKIKVKLELPSYSNLDFEDPMDFIDRFEEYNELRPLYPEELLASLSVSLKSTA